MSKSAKDAAIVEAQIIEGIDVDHLTEEFDHVAVELYPDGDLRAVPYRQHSDELPFDYDSVGDEVDLTNYQEVCAYVRENAERAGGPIDFEPPTFVDIDGDPEPW